MSVKVLAILPTYYPEVGGGALASHLIIKLLSQSREAQITVLTGARNPEKAEGVNYYYDPLLKLIDKLYVPPHVLLSRYGNVLKKHDVVYITYAYPLIPIAKKLGKRVVAHLHDYRPISPSGFVLAGSDNRNLFHLLKEGLAINILEKGIRRLSKEVLNLAYTSLVRKWTCMADVILAVSKRHAEILLKYMPECKDKVRVMYNPVPPIPKIRKNINITPTFLYVGGDNLLKGFHVLLKSIERIVKQNTPVKFIFTNRYGKKALQAIDKLNKLCGNKIEVKGVIKKERLLKLHEKTWALLFPSISEEPMPYAVMEALIAGTLPIATRVGGIPEIVENTLADKFLIAPYSSWELAEAINTVASYDVKYVTNTLNELLSSFDEKRKKIFDPQKIVEDLTAILI